MKNIPKAYEQGMCRQLFCVSKAYYRLCLTNAREQFAEAVI